MEGEIAAVLPTAAPLDHRYDILKNKFTRNSNRYGVLPLGGDNSIGILKHYTIDRTFQVILTEDYGKNSMTDEGIRNAVNELHDRLDTIYKRLYHNKAGLSNIILNVILSSDEDAEVIDEHKVVVLRANMEVKYRNRIDS
jgi:hypothetical protein